MDYLARARDLDDRMVDALRTFVETESPTADLAACIDVAHVGERVINEWLGQARIQMHDGRPVVMWGNAQPRIALLGHLDTVWPLGTVERIPFAVNEDRITGPGVFDMKAGVVQTIAALALLQGIVDLSEVGLLLTTDEETGSATSRQAIADFVSRAQACLVMEPSAEGALKTERKGTSWYTVHVEGRAAHAGLDPAKGINALVHAADFIQRTVQWGTEETSVTPTVMSAGTTTNTVPALATISVDVRAWNRAEQERVDHEIRSWSSAPATVRIDGGIDRAALEKTMSESLFRTAQEAAESMGLPPLQQCAVGGASDGNLTAAAGVPTLDGLGAVGDGAHADHEWASRTGMIERSALLASLIERLTTS